ncbi:hypothetical protein [Streptomyces sp. NPDC047043]
MRQRGPDVVEPRRAVTNRTWTTQAGPAVPREEYLPQGADRPALFWS